MNNIVGYHDDVCMQWQKQLPENSFLYTPYIVIVVVWSWLWFHSCRSEALGSSLLLKCKFSLYIYIFFVAFFFYQRRCDIVLHVWVWMCAWVRICVKYEQPPKRQTKLLIGILKISKCRLRVLCYVCGMVIFPEQRYVFC